MKINKKGLDILKNCESCKLEAYPDPSSPRAKSIRAGKPKSEWDNLSGKPWTVGYGHTGFDVTKEKVITQEEAEELLRQDVEKVENLMNANILASRIQVNENEFSALVCLAYNVGMYALLSSRMWQRLKENNHTAAANEFDGWDHAGGEVLAGLTKRRFLEKQLFTEGVNS